MKIENKQTIKISLNLTHNEYEEIKKLVQEKKYINSSEFIREAVRLRLEKIKELKRA